MRDSWKSSKNLWPLGLIAPITFQKQLLYRNACEEESTWDAPLSVPLEQQGRGGSSLYHMKFPAQQSIEKIEPHPLEDTSGKGVATAKQPSTINQELVTVKARLAKQGLTIPWRELVSGLTWLFMPAKNQPWHTTSNLKIQRWTLELNIILMHSTSHLVISIFFQSLLKSIFMGWTFNYKTWSEMYPGFQIRGSSGPLLEKFGGPLLSFGGPANL